MSTKIIVTTSRRPSPRSRSLVKDLLSVLPHAVRITRGHTSLEELARMALAVGASRVVILAERKGNPGLLRVYEPITNPLALKDLSTFIIRGVKLAREAGTRSSIKPKLLYVVSDGSEISDHVAEEFVRSFYAKIFLGRTPSGAVLARITSLSDNLCFVRFFYKENQIGPELKLSKPRQVAKNLS